MNNNSNLDLPITAICIVTDRSKCPPNYTPIYKSYDSNSEIDLWKDGLFGKKISRFICYTKDYPIADTYNVIEDIKLLNEKDNVIGGFLPLDKCQDTGEKAFQKKLACIKVSHRFFTNMAVSDIIVLVRSKRPPPGYLFIGDINNHSICIKFSQIPNTASSVPHSLSTSYIGQQPPPIPPRPPQYPLQTQGMPMDPAMQAIEQSFVHIRTTTPPQDYKIVNGNSHDYLNSNNTLQRTIQSQNSQTAYNPLQGVPFEINPIYRKNGNSDEFIDLERINRKYNLLMEQLKRYNYDFTLEKSCLDVLNASI